MPSLQSILEDPTTRAGRAFALTVQALIILSLVTFTIETLPHLSETARWWLYAVEVGTVAIFTVEYLLRIVVADHKLRFIFSFYGIVDLLAILPFYLATGLDLRSIRIVRVLRLFRILKLARYSAAMRRFHRAFDIAKEEIVLFLSAAGMMLYLSSVGIYYLESDAQPEAFGSVFHCLWWAVVTMTTVGYGDVYPITVGGRIFTFLVLMTGLGVVAVPTGIMASALTKVRKLEDDEAASLKEGEAAQVLTPDQEGVGTTSEKR